jgi:hypothetical protein
MNFEVFGLGKGWVQVRTFMSFYIFWVGSGGEFHELFEAFWIG